MTSEAAEMPCMTWATMPACCRYASPEPPDQSAISLVSASMYWSCAAAVNLETFAQVVAWAAIASGLPASQSSASLSGLTCSISQETPQATSEPSGSITMPRMSRLPPTVPSVPSTQLLSWMPLDTWAASSTRPRPVYQVVELCSAATSGFVTAVALSPGCSRPPPA